MDYRRILITGGSGTLGKAILSKARRDGMKTQFVVMSRDPIKLQKIKALFPDVETAVGDVTSTQETMYAMSRCDVVIHAAAMKHIPEGEYNPISVCQVNVTGSIVVGSLAAAMGVKHVVGISTDKACKPLNAYGASKLLNEKVFQSLSAQFDKTEYHLVRYGNVVGSTGSVVQIWKDAEEKFGEVKITNPNMTRFWLSANQAAELIFLALKEPTGTIAVPILKSVRMGDVADYVLSPTTKRTVVGLRPGEKIDEELVGAEESVFSEHVTTHEIPIYRIWPSFNYPKNIGVRHRYTSADGPFMSKEDFLKLLETAQ